MTDEELIKLVESNARTAQAMLDSMAEARLERQELREGMANVQKAIDRLVLVEERITRLLASLDEDRPPILQKLTSIENKIYRMLEKDNHRE